MDALFDKLPYDLLRKYNLVQMISVAAAFGVFLFVGYYFSLYSFQEEEMAALQTKKKQSETKLRRYKNLLRQKNTIESGLFRATGNLALIKSQMPKRKEILAFIKQISEIGEIMGLEILLIESKPEKAVDFYKEIQIEIRVSGGFYQTIGFFESIQNLLRIVNINNLKLEPKKISIKVGNRRVKSRRLETSSMAVTFSYIDGAEDKPPKNT
jgi:type IV pilus assembly protein PilO